MGGWGFLTQVDAGMYCSHPLLSRRVKSGETTTSGHVPVLEQHRWVDIQVFFVQVLRFRRLLPMFRLAGCGEAVFTTSKQE